MTKKKYIEIKRPVPLKDQETNYNRRRGEQWRLDTSEPAEARKWQKKGYSPVDEDRDDGYLTFYLPEKALTGRSRFAIENAHQAANLPNRSKDDEGSGPESPKVGEESAPKTAIGVEDHR